MTKKISIAGSIATIVSMFLILFPNDAKSTNKTSYGQQSPVIDNMENSNIIYNNQTVNNYQQQHSDGLYLKNTILLPEPSLQKVNIKYSLCNVENGSKVEVLEEVFNMTYWIKVKVIDGSCRNIIGWTGKENLIKK